MNILPISTTATAGGVDCIYTVVSTLGYQPQHDTEKRNDHHSDKTKT